MALEMTNRMHAAAQAQAAALHCKVATPKRLKHWRFERERFHSAFFGMDAEWRIAAAFVKLGTCTASVADVMGVFGCVLGEGQFDACFVRGVLLQLAHARFIRFSSCGTKLRLFRGAYDAAKSALSAA